MLKVFLAFMLGGTGIVQLLDRRYKAFLGFVYCWVGGILSLVAAFLILAVVQPNWEGGMDFSLASVAFLFLLLLHIAFDIRIAVLHIQTIIQSLMDYSSESNQKK